MPAIGNKTKQFLIAIAKLSVAGAAIYSLGAELSDKAKHDWGAFFGKLDENFSLLLATVILLLAVSNRFLEILKWKCLASTVRKTSLSEAAKQVLAGMAFGIVTPAGVGEYAGKAFFFPPENRKNIVFLNLVCNGIQMLLTVFFGIFGLLYLTTITEILSPRTLCYIALATVTLVLLLLFVRKISIRGWSVERLLHKINKLPRKVHRTNLLLAIGRYLSFSHQQYFLLLLFGVHPDYIPMMAVITGVYLLASCLPTFQLLDFAVKGSLSVWFFHLVGVDGLPVVCAATSIWLLNVVVPVAAGSVFVLRLKTNR